MSTDNDKPAEVVAPSPPPVPAPSMPAVVMQYHVGWDIVEAVAEHGGDGMRIVGWVCFDFNASESVALSRDGKWLEQTDDYQWPEECVWPTAEEAIAALGEARKHKGNEPPPLDFYPRAVMSDGGTVAPPSGSPACEHPPNKRTTLLARPGYKHCDGCGKWIEVPSPGVTVPDATGAEVPPCPCPHHAKQRDGYHYIPCAQCDKGPGVCFDGVRVIDRLAAELAAVQGAFASAESAIETLEAERDRLTSELTAAHDTLDVERGIVRGLKMEASAAHRALSEAREQLATAQQALATINDIRNSIVGLQTINWSEHIYPLVTALNGAGVLGMPYPDAKPRFASMLERAVKAEDQLAASALEVERLRERDALATVYTFPDMTTIVRDGRGWSASRWSPATRDSEYLTATGRWEPVKEDSDGPGHYLFPDKAACFAALAAPSDSGQPE